MAGDILIVDDLSINRTILRAKLRCACYATRLAVNGASALSEAFKETPGLILLDYHLSDMTGVDVCKKLRADPRTSDVPIILFSSSTDRRHRLAALTAGADDFISKPMDENFMLARVRSLLRAQARHAELACGRDLALARALAMADPGTEQRLGIRILVPVQSKGSYWLDRVTGLFPDHDCRALSFVEMMTQSDANPKPDLCIITPELISSQGLGIISNLQSRDNTRCSGLVVIMPRADLGMGAMALDLGASDVLNTPLDADEARLRFRIVLQRKRQLERDRSLLERELHLASIDPLTGLYNRRYVERRLTEMKGNSSMDGHSYAVVLLDLDHFKRINDTLGHKAGDDVLVEVARRFRAAFSGPGDILARYGGEEFVAIMVGAGMAEARSRAEAACDSLNTLPVQLKVQRTSVAVTASAGVAVRRGDCGMTAAGSITSAIDEADRALRASKQAGRNIVTIARVNVA